MGHMDDVIDTSFVYLYSYIASCDNRGGIVNKDCVINKTFEGCCSKWEFFIVKTCLIQMNSDYYELSFNTFANLRR
jgi:hypothetical protein